METHSNRLLVFAFVGTLLATLLVFAVWLFLGSNPYGRDYLIRFEDSVTGVSKGGSCGLAILHPWRCHRKS